MPESDEIQWIKATANELNNLLQVITESSRFLQLHSGGKPETQHYFDMIRSAVDRATQLSRAMLERTDQPGAPTPLQQPPAPAAARGNVHPFPMPGQFAAMPAPAQTQPQAPKATLGTNESGSPDDIKIANPNGPRELILIVDDENFVTLLAQRVLTDEGY